MPRIPVSEVRTDFVPHPAVGLIAAA